MEPEPDDGPYVDALPLLSLALAQLGPAQLVKADHVTLLDLMSAIEVCSSSPALLSVP